MLKYVGKDKYIDKIIDKNNEMTQLKIGYNLVIRSVYCTINKLGSFRRVYTTVQLCKIVVCSMLSKTIGTPVTLLQGFYGYIFKN